MQGNWRRAFRLLSLPVGLVLALAGCGGGANYPDVDSAQIQDQGPIFRSLNLALSSDGGAEVEYGADGDPLLVVNTDSNTSRSHQLSLPRLRANTKYTYRIRTKRDGQISDVRHQGEFTTGDLPDDLKAATIRTSGTPSQPLTFVALRAQFSGGVVFDAKGRIVWYARTSIPPQGATRRANGHWVLELNGVGLAEFSELGQQVAFLPQSRMPAGVVIHHGVTATPRNTLLFLAFEPRIFNGVSLAGEAIWEWDPESDSLVKRWSAFDFFDPLVDFGTRSVPTDWFHANSVAIGLRGNIVVSFHFLNQIISIAPDFSAVEWRLGGPGSSLPVTAAQVTSGQHSARETQPSQILMFDNGFQRDDGSRYSRAIELKMDTATSSVSTVWEYRPAPDIWSSVISSVRRLPGNSNLVTFGFPTDTASAFPQLTLISPIVIQEVTAQGQVVWTAQITVPNGSIFQGDSMSAVGAEVTR